MRVFFGCDHEGCGNRLQLERDFEADAYDGAVFMGGNPENGTGVYVEMLEPRLLPEGWVAVDVPYAKAPGGLLLYCGFHAAEAGG